RTVCRVLLCLAFAASWNLARHAAATSLHRMAGLCNACRNNVRTRLLGYPHFGYRRHPAAFSTGENRGLRYLFPRVDDCDNAVGSDFTGRRNIRNRILLPLERNRFTHTARDNHLFCICPAYPLEARTRQGAESGG